MKTYKISQTNIVPLLERYSEMFKFFYMDDPSIAPLALSIHGYYIKYIENPSEEFQLIAITQDSSSIKHIKNPTPKIQLLAIKDDYNNFKRIKNPIEEVQKIAITKDYGYMMDIKNPSKDILDIFHKKLQSYINNKKMRENEIWDYRILKLITNKKLDSISLVMLLQLAKDESTKELIKKHKNWKNEAQLIIAKMEQ